MIVLLLACIAVVLFLMFLFMLAWGASSVKVGWLTGLLMIIGGLVAYFYWFVNHVLGTTIDRIFP